MNENDFKKTFSLAPSVIFNETIVETNSTELYFEHDTAPSYLVKHNYILDKGKLLIFSGIFVEILLLSVVQSNKTYFNQKLKKN